MEFPEIEQQVWPKIRDPEYCTEHKVFWQPTIETTDCPACALHEELSTLQAEFDEMLEESSESNLDISDLQEENEKLSTELANLKVFISEIKTGIIKRGL